MDGKNSIIYKQVKKIVHKFGTNNPMQIARESNITIKYLNDLEDLLGLYTVFERKRFIFLNNNLDEYMMRMVLAHELGHDTLHRHLTKDRPFQEHVLFDITSQPEYEANIFAAHLLLDDNQVMELIENDYTDVEIAGLLNVNLNLLMFKLNEMNKYGTSYKLRHEPKGDFFTKIKP